MIKNIIFDFGGVIYDINHNLSKIAFEKLGVENFDELYGHQIQAKTFEKMERGELELDVFRDELRKVIPKNVSDQQIDDAWCGLLLGFDTKKLDLLKSIGRNYRIFLLSNSNEIHYMRFIEELNEYFNFRSLFEDVWFSHEKGMRKPEPEFYMGLLINNDLKASESLFVDDLETNIFAAKNIGIKTHYIQNDSILDMFEDGKLKVNY
ncbi:MULTISPECIES: HAD family phosphatase [unclassified Lentimicrobium]|uniref:HAD family hydrolase n=1 Tax=unclassified Lentimicrobium TaxID=2677434 RepID=UPI0015519D40|nr:MULTISPECIES: HAD family phosphatase [unclassified Lentimicrobium]NPD46964.1 HAD family phosphatase [Lentimicrobium sp. S6]NPD84730.1 HAD family phosphatase [Lentimicrobium sp. L6]